MNVVQRIFPTLFGPPNSDIATICSRDHDAILGHIPAAYSDVSAILLNANLAVIPGDWSSGDLTIPFHDIVPTDPCVSDAFTHIKSVDFVAWHESFFSVIGPNARLETIQSFSPDSYHVHEAPVYIPETNELLYSDTSLVGQLWAINIDNQLVRKITTDPPLHNVNGGTYHKGQVYVATNGGSARGIFKVNYTTGAATAVVNNYRGRHLNSPNDLIFDSASNLFFTDPTYGWDHRWPGVQAPELPAAVYRFDAKTKALTALSAGMLGKPNGLALARDARTLYVADSASTADGIGGQRAVWAFEVVDNGAGIRAPRLVHQTEDGWPDGLRVTEHGWLMVAVTGGVDVLNPDSGAVLGRISTPGDIIFNLEPARGKGVWLLTGKKNIYKVTIREGPIRDTWVPKVLSEATGLTSFIWK